MRAFIVLCSLLPLIVLGMPTSMIEAEKNETMLAAAEEGSIAPRAAVESAYLNETVDGEKIEDSEIAPRAVNESEIAAANETTMVRRRRSADVDDSFANETMIADDAEIEPRAANETFFVNETADGEKIQRAVNETEFEMEDSTIEPRSANESLSSRRRRRSVDDESFGNETMLAEESEIAPRAVNETSYLNETADGEKIPRSANQTEELEIEEAEIKPRAVNESEIVANETMSRRRRAIEDELISQPIIETSSEGSFEQLPSSEIAFAQSRFVNNLALLSEDLYLLAEKIESAKPENATAENEAAEKPEGVVADLTYLAEDVQALAEHLNQTASLETRLPRAI